MCLKTILSSIGEVSEFITGLRMIKIKIKIKISKICILYWDFSPNNCSIFNIPQVKKFNPYLRNATQRGGTTRDTERF
jgi:hypothetical protein